MEPNKSLYLTFISCLLSRVTVIKSYSASPYYKDLRLVSTSNAIVIQMNGSILRVRRLDYSLNMNYLSLPNDDCRIDILYGKYVFNPDNVMSIYSLPEWKFHQNKTFIDVIVRKMYALEPTYLSLMKFLFQEKPINVFKYYDAGGYRGITIKYKTLVDFYELLLNVSDYHEINPSNIHLFMITNKKKFRFFCPQNICL